MSLTIQTATTPVGAPTFDDPARIARLASAQGSHIPAGATVVGITIPIIRSDQTGLQYHTRNSGTEFLFNTGTLRLTLRQEIHLSRALSLCARTIWLQHEQKHVRDNEQLISRMDAELRADRQFADILVSPSRWRPRADFNRTQQTIQARVGEVFERLTSQAARHQDSRREYQRVERQVRIRCGRTLGRILKQGMYGNGIDIVQHALNNESPSALPRLAVDGIFGPKTDARVREFQRNRRLNPDGVVGRNTRNALGI
jgi:peptidoglycan hydrolase-like protein with peptidoglycan-binding domain